MTGLLGGASRFPGLLGDPQPNLAGRPGFPPVPPAIVTHKPVPQSAGLKVPVRPMPLLERLRGAVADAGGAVGTALGGRGDPRLSDEQNRAAQQQAMLMAGLQMLAASGPSAQPVGLGQILAQGAMAGQQTGAQERERIYMGTQEERLEQALNDPEVMGRLTPEQQRLVRLLPPPEAVKLLTEMAFKPDAAPVVVGEGGALVDPRTGQPVFQNERSEFTGLPSDFRAILAANGVDAATWESLPVADRQAALGQYEDFKRASATQVNVGAPDQRFANTNELAGAFRGEIGQFQEVANAYGRVLTAATDPSPAGDIALIFSYMKMLDPGSTVREGEFATAQNAGSVPQRIRALYNQVATQDGRLDADQRRDFVDRSRRLADQKRAQIQPVLERYRRRAQVVDLDPSTFIFDPFAEIGMDSQPAPAPDPFAGM